MLPDPPLPSLALAQDMPFAEIGKALRHFVDHYVADSSGLLLERAATLVSLLEQKIPFPIPPSPNPPDSTQPIAPLEVHKPVRPAIEPSAEITQCREYYQPRIEFLQQEVKFPLGNDDRKARRRLDALVAEKEEAITAIVCRATNSEGLSLFCKQHAKWKEYETKYALFEKALADHARNHNIYKAELAAWNIMACSLKQKRKTDESIVATLRKDIERLRNPANSPELQYLRWRVLPAGEAGVQALTACLEESRRINPDFDFDKRRIKHAIKLKPKRISKGCDDFNDYYAFQYERTDRVLLESERRGNAAYILLKDWEVLSRLSKRELNELHYDSISRIFHNEEGDWECRIESSLQFRPTTL